MSVTEAEAGITEYATAALGFTGILKHRFRDFQVNEVDLQGNVARLTTLDPPRAAELPVPGTPSKPAYTPLSGGQLADAAPDIAAAFSKVAGEQNAELLLQLIKAVAAATTLDDGQAQNSAAADADTASEAAAAAAPAAAAEPTEQPGAPSTTAGAPQPSQETVPGPEGAAVEKLPGGCLQIKLEPSDNKDTRRALHEFFKTHALLPRMETRMHEQGGRKIHVTWQPSAGAQARGGADQAGGRGGGGRGRGGRGKRSRDDADGGRRPGWEGGRDQYTRFVMYKENMESQMAVGLLSSYLRTNVNAFGYAGTKDKRGVTTQFMTVHKVEPWKLADLNSKLRGVRVGGPWGYSPKQLQLGALSGNEFRLVMRSVAPTPAARSAQESQPKGGQPDQQVNSGLGQEEQPQQQHAVGSDGGCGSEGQVEEACRRVSEVGFINYFGLQRFGTGGAPTHQIGAALLRGEIERAIHLIMVGRPGEKPDVAAARAPYLQRGDAKASLRLMPRWATAERAILEVLSRHQQPNKTPGASSAGKGSASADAAPGGAPAADGAAGPAGAATAGAAAAGTAASAGPTHSPVALAAAMRAIPRTLRMMYLHAYQSYLWNLAASQRIREHGVHKVLAGDLVLPGNASASTADAEEAVEGLEGEAGAAVVGLGDGADAAAAAGVDGAVEGGPPGSARHRLSCVRVVTEEEAREGRWSIHDVVLPMPGSMVRYPQHATAAVYAQTAARDGVTLVGKGLPEVEGDAAPGGSSAGAAGDGQGQQQRVGDKQQGAVAPDCKEWKSLAAECSLAALTGDYRHVLLKPKAFEWRLQRYSDPNDDSLTTTDLEQLIQDGTVAPGASLDWRQAKRARADPASAQGQADQGVQAGQAGEAGREEGSQAAADGGADQPMADTEQTPASRRPEGGDAYAASAVQKETALSGGLSDEGSKPLLALSLRFQLPSSCYATMLIRELTKQSTHKDFQAGLSGAL